VASGSTDAARPELAAVLDALAEGDVNGVLVALSALLAGGWGAQQLATELIDDLRQVFLAALAPELCAASGRSLERFRSLAETMGLARVVRSMEILGHALVDMREAPDAQVVLEIAVVRAVRPDLDSGVEALSERVSVLERSLSGDAAFPRPGAPARATPPADAAAVSDAAAGPIPPVTTPAPPAGDTADVARRPSLGAVRRTKQAAADVAPATASATAAAPGVAAPVEGPAVGRASEPVPSPGSGSPSGPGASRTVDRDSLTEAWGDGILQALPARAKARFASGRFVAVDDRGAHFALPNAAHRDQCAEQQSLVEAALASHFGTEVKLVLEIDASAAPAAARATGPSPIGRSAVPDLDESHPDDLGDVDADDFVEAPSGTDETAAAEARLLEAFPGASEVVG